MTRYPLIPLTGAQKNAYHAIAENPPQSPAFAKVGPSNPNLRIFVVNFDGTGNNRLNKAEPQTLVADSHDSFEALGNPHIESRYYKGVATETKSAGEWIREAAAGRGVASRADAAYHDLCEQYREWCEDNPDIEVHVHVTAFSRGCASALKFMNRVDKRGITRLFMHERNKPGAVKTSAVLFDAVTTGAGTAFGDEFSEDDFQLPDSNISTLHVVAGGEERPKFELTSLKDPLRPSDIAMARNVDYLGQPGALDKVIVYARLHELWLPCARHSDVGGAFEEGRIREMSGYLMSEFQRSLGLPVFSRRPSFDDIQAMHATDKRWKSDVEEFADVGTDVPRRQRAVRTIGRHPKPVWKGLYTEQVILAQGGQRNSRTRVVASHPSDWKLGVNLPDLCTNYDIRFNLAAGHDGKERVIIEADARHGFHFDVSTGLLMKQSLAIQSVPRRDIVAEMVRKAARSRHRLGSRRRSLSLLPGSPPARRSSLPPARRTMTYRTRSSGRSKPSTPRVRAWKAACCASASTAPWMRWLQRFMPSTRTFRRCSSKRSSRAGTSSRAT